jgi:phenylpyruvate tautomerase PptA (4-oxalocrotonate tautomerase family)
MPYMYCRISEGRTPEQKQKIAEGISAVIDKYIGPPPWMAPETTDRSPMKLECHMVEIPAYNLARGGKLLEGGSLSAYVVINVMNERPRDLKGSIAKEVTDVVARQFGIPPESQDIIVEIVETAEYNISHGGILTYDSMPPGTRSPVD